MKFQIVVTLSKREHIAKGVTLWKQVEAVLGQEINPANIASKVSEVSVIWVEVSSEIALCCGHFVNSETVYVHLEEQMFRSLFLTYTVGNNPQKQYVLKENLDEEKFLAVWKNWGYPLVMSFNEETKI